MPSRYTTVDIIVGVGMCAILFGALLLFIAANGTYQVVLPQPVAIEEPAAIQVGMEQLQPVIGQAIVDEALFERSSAERMARSVTEWNRATIANRAFQSRAGGPFGAVMRQAETGPVDHLARVQGVMGRAIVNFTRRAVRSGVLSADVYLSDYNARMIRTIERRGQQLHDQFSSTWQATLGQGIVEAFQTYTERAGAIQERLGTALVQMVQSQRVSDDVRSALREQLGSLVTAAVRTEALSDRLTLLAAIESFPEDTEVASTQPATWPEIPIGYLIVFGLILAAIFFGGISLSAQRRENKALAEMRQNAAKWVYRTAA